ncbi:MAG: hypothetical protein Q8W44_11615 [Candidatus Palauibacterales bacterium]|nr:hypothetical protein [Candidatus Palauibacterales bacterium]
MSLAMEVGRLAAEQVDRELLPRVSAVGVEVGDRAGVVIDALEFCLQAVLTEPPFDDARPVLERCRGDVLRLAWIDVEDGIEDGDGDRDGTAAVADGGGNGPSPLGDAPLPSEAGPPRGAGDGSRADSNQGKGVR